MADLHQLACPRCDRPMNVTRVDDLPRRATSYETCLRRCEPCRIGASNASGKHSATFIYAEPLLNIPEESREGAAEALSAALNVRNRASKFTRFGFSTSEDAVTWVVFTYLLRRGLLMQALQRGGVIEAGSGSIEPTLLLWGSPIGLDERGIDVRSNLLAQCKLLGEHEDSLSEPDVIVDMGSAGLVFIEVKYLSGNDQKVEAYRGWPKYASGGQLEWDFEAVKASGQYELARNWCLLHALAKGRPAILANLGFDSLFSGKKGMQLQRFYAALRTSSRRRFVHLSWGDLLSNVVPTADLWFNAFCNSRRLVRSSRLQRPTEADRGYD